MKFFQKELQISPKKRGFHLITNEIIMAIPEIKDISIGQLQVFIKHTSASLTINENADASVRADFESHFNKMVPENMQYYIHTYEGPDDMPAHIKSAMMPVSLQIPVAQGQMRLGTWQGIYLFEHRRAQHVRRVAAHFATS